MTSVEKPCQRNRKELEFSCKITSGEYAKIVFGLFFSENWIFILVPFVVSGCLSLIDIRIFLVSLMLLMVLVPFVMFLLYAYYMLTDSMVWSVTDKRVELSEFGKLTITFDHPKLSPISLDKERVKRLVCYKKCVLLQVEEKRYRLLALPDCGFPGEELRAKFIQALTPEK